MSDEAGRTGGGWWRDAARKLFGISVSQAGYTVESTEKDVRDSKRFAADGGKTDRSMPVMDVAEPWLMSVPPISSKARYCRPR